MNITVEEAALRLSLSEATVKRKLSDGSIVGSKLGGRWIVDGGRLPVRLPSNSPRLNLKAVDVKASFQQVMRADNRDLWVPDILMWEDYRKNPDMVLEDASLKCINGTADPFEVVSVPKGEYLSRAGALLSIADRVAYQALCYSFVEKVEAQLIDTVYSSRLSTTGKSGLFKLGTEQWRVFNDAVSTTYTTLGPWLVKTDLVSYFDTISHQLLFDDLNRMDVPDEITRPLRNLLRTWRDRSQRGIPIGPDASRILGNLFMVPVDSAMQEAGFHYFRYMDDVRLVAGTRREALHGLRYFELLCRDRGLIVNEKKTSVSDVVRKAPEDEQLEQADYFFRNSFSESRKALRQLFSEAIAEPAIKRRNARFALIRLANIVDKQVLKKLINKLDSLGEISKDSALYLRAFISESQVQKAIGEYLDRPLEPEVEQYQQAWLLAAMLEVIGQPPDSWLNYVKPLVRDANQPVFLRGLAINLAVLGGEASLMDQVREMAQNSYDPALVRACITALKRVDALDKATMRRVADRLPQLKPTIEYLRDRQSLPSLIQQNLWSRLHEPETTTDLT